ncbi:hypothetical protein ES703_72307 [subsurface metagenome]
MGLGRIQRGALFYCALERGDTISVYPIIDGMKGKNCPYLFPSSMQFSFQCSVTGLLAGFMDLAMQSATFFNVIFFYKLGGRL